MHKCVIIAVCAKARAAVNNANLPSASIFQKIKKPEIKRNHLYGTFREIWYFKQNPKEFPILFNFQDTV